MTPTEDLTLAFRTKVAETIKDRPKKQKSRVQVNASFSKAEYAVLSRGSAKKSVSVSRLVKDLALQSMGQVPSDTQAELGQITAGIQETSQLLRSLYLSTNGWQKVQFKELRPLLRRLLTLERKASAVLESLTA